jgi:hypothetical protein
MGTKKSVGRPKVDSELVRARLPRAELDALDAFAGDETDHPKRPEALRRIVRDHLVGLGYLDSSKK